MKEQMDLRNAIKDPNVDPIQKEWFKKRLDIMDKVVDDYIRKHGFSK